MADHPGKAALAAIMEAANNLETTRNLYDETGEGDLSEAEKRFMRALTGGVRISTKPIASVAAYVAELEAERDAAKIAAAIRGG